MSKKMLVILLIVITFITGCGKKDVKEKNSESKVSSPYSNIKKMIISGSESELSLIALTEDNKLYAYGDILNKDVLDKPKELATNVKDFYSNITTILYTDLNNNLYARSIMPTISEDSSTFTQLASNVNKFQFCGFDGIMVLDNDKNYYLQVSSSGSKFCGYKDGYSSFTKIDFGNNMISDLGGNFSLSSYLFSNGDLYETRVNSIYDGKGTTYNKILSNVKEITDYYAITNTNEIYYINDSGFKGSIDKVTDNGKKIYDDYYQTSDGKFHYISYSGAVYIKDIEKENIKEMLYGKDLTKLVYIDTNNKLVLSTEIETKKLDFNPSSMKEVYDFIK